MSTIAERASAYLARMGPSISGKGGHCAAFDAAVALVRGFGLSEREAYPHLARWNADCQPPWSESDLRNKLRSAACSNVCAPGYLLRENDAWPPARTAPDFESESEKNARLRQSWPEFQPLTHEDIDTIAQLRGIWPDAVDLAHRHGFFGAVMHHGHRCFAVGECGFAQLRRMDGKPLQKVDGRYLEAQNLSGSQEGFIGRRWLERTTHVLLVEGAIGLVEGLAAMLLVNTPHAWSILAATSASSRFGQDSALLERLKGRHVRIVPGADHTGCSAAASWHAELEEHGLSTDIVRLPAGNKDLGDFLQTGDCLPTLQRIFCQNL